VTFGRSAKTSDGLVETLAAWWQGLSATEHGEMDRVPIKRDHGSASRGVRTPLLHRLVPLVATIGKPLHLLSEPPSHSQYNPLERGWGRMAWPWHGAQLIEVETMREWAKRLTWKGLPPVVELSRPVYAKGVSLSKAARRAVEARLERHPLLPKWDILIHPAGAD
jgi:Rhodopirellula transposase DDE domain